MPAKKIHRKCAEVERSAREVLLAARFSEAKFGDWPTIKASGFCVSLGVGAVVEVGYLFVDQEKITDVHEALSIQQDELEKYIVHLRQAFPDFKVRLKQTSPHNFMIAILL